MAGDSTVVRPSWAWFALLDGGIVVLAVLSFRAEGGVEDRVDGGGAITRSGPVLLPPQRVLRWMLVGTAAIHVAEALAAARAARRGGLPAWGWAAQTFVVGFPSLLALRRVRAAVEPGS